MAAMYLLLISHSLKIGFCVCLQFVFLFSVGFLLIMGNKLIKKQNSLSVCFGSLIAELATLATC